MNSQECEGREFPEKTVYYSIYSKSERDLASSLASVKDLKGSFRKKQTDTTYASQQGFDKSISRGGMTTIDRIDESCLEDLEDLIKKMPKNLSNEVSSMDMSYQFSLAHKGKQEMTPSAFVEKEKYKAQTNWLNELQVKCTIGYNNKKVKTICKIKDAELQFENGAAFRLTKITKMKVLYQDYDKCICFTYDDVQGKKTVEIKFKIFIENDSKDDLYLFFAKIIVEKLFLLGHEVNLQEGEDLDADKFMMTGDVLKKGQVMNKWNQRKLVLTDRIESFRDNKCTFQMKNIKELWTRFQFYDSCLIVKLRHGKDKTQLAIPVVNYPVRFCRNNWLYRIYRLLAS